MAAGVTLFKTFATTELNDSYASIDGFITNTANYGAVKEPFLTYNEEVGGSEVYTPAGQAPGGLPVQSEYRRARLRFELHCSLDHPDDLLIYVCGRLHGCRRWLPIDPRVPDRYLALWLGRSAPAHCSQHQHRPQYLCGGQHDRPAQRHGQLVQPVKRWIGRSANGNPYCWYFGLRLDQASG